MEDEKTPDQIDWSHVAPEFKWMARDSDGEAYLYEYDPHIQRVKFWIEIRGDTANATAFASYKRGTVDWKDSLVKRPD